ncbi:MAG: hypothetical protein HY901_04610, partial [Deltaproteobacteria bacterium]|nr:hypothetical protein [Deltaproteobacteria bacterium]
MTSHGVALRWVVLGGLLLEMVACAGPRLRPRKAAPGEIEDGSTITLAESAPTETTLDLPDIPNADGVWLEMINAATRAIDLSHFYTSDQPPSRLTPIIGALRAAVARGVRVRFLVDESVAAKYPETLDALTGQAGLQLRKLAVQKLMGGVQHAKYMVIDRREAYLGSQNFDWRSLEHIQEMGVRIRSKRVAGALLDVFETDWEFAGGAPANLRIVRRPDADAVRLFTGETVTFVASPKGWLPDEAEWDLPKLVRLIDQARSELGIQLLTYKTKSYDGSLFLELDRALRRAAARGVGVRLLVSDWSNKPSSEARRSISALSQVPG